VIPPDPLAGLGPATIIRGDARALPLPDTSVDLVVTSPPYFALRSYQDGGAHYDGQIGSEATPAEFVAALLDCTREMVRVLKPSGSIFVNLGDSYQNKCLLNIPARYAITCTDEMGLIERAEIIWRKPNGLPESVTDRVRRSHEQFFHFTKEPRYFAAVDEIREPHADDRPLNPSRNGRGDRGGDPRGMTKLASQNLGVLGNPLGKLPGSVREVPSAPLKVPAHLGIDHFAAFPPAWPAWTIRGWSPTGVCTACGEGRRPVADVPYERRQNDRPGARAERNADNNRNDGALPYGSSALRLTTITGYACACPTSDAPTRPAVVLDPFGGTGTTAMAARALGRHGISVDLSNDYCRLARWRCGDRDELATVRGLPRTGPVDVEQGSILDLLGDVV
jgi:DNA modification methylase